MQMTLHELVKASQKAAGLSVQAGSQGLGNAVSHPSLQRTGLGLAGLEKAIVRGRLQIWGASETSFVAMKSPPDHQEQIDSLQHAGAPAIVLSGGRAVPDGIRAAANQAGLPILASALGTSSLMAQLQHILFAYLSPKTTLHAVLVDVFGVGVVLTGQSGIGKSECALDLILRGHRLIADDAVVVRRHEKTLIGASSLTMQHHMEVRGLGIINVKDLFGTASVCDFKSLDLFVEMVDWRPRESYDRLGLDDAHERIFDVLVPKVRLPVSPGRNLASIVEVAARNYLLKAQGHHAAKKLQDRIEAELAQTRNPLRFADKDD